MAHAAHPGRNGEIEHLVKVITGHGAAWLDVWRKLDHLWLGGGNHEIDAPVAMQRKYNLTACSMVIWSGWHIDLLSQSSVSVQAQKVLTRPIERAFSVHTRDASNRRIWGVHKLARKLSTWVCMC